MKETVPVVPYDGGWPDAVPTEASPAGRAPRGGHRNPSDEKHRSCLDRGKGVSAVEGLSASLHHRELTKRDMAEGIGGRLLGAGVTKVDLGDDFAMVEVDAPAHLCGKSLRDIGVRARYGVQVLLVRQVDQDSGERVDVVPDPDTAVHLGDRLVLLGRSEALALFER